jgi:hypothetical protein
VPDNTPPNIWQLQVAQQFNGLEICAGPGVSFDWIWSELYQYQDEIDPSDQVLVVLTEPTRHWYFKDIPGLSHPGIRNLREYVDADQATALEYYITHLQRDDLDYLNAQYKLGWLSQIATLKRWSNPIVISAFPEPTYSPKQYPNLIGSTGNLTNVSLQEVDTKNNYSKLFGARDFRYNHFCLDNHKVLADKVILSLASGNPIDLTIGFRQGIVTDTNIANSQWIQQQVDSMLFKEMHG